MSTQYTTMKKKSNDNFASHQILQLEFKNQVRDPERDCTKFDPVLRARELFEALDINGDGGVSEEEFIRLGLSFKDCSSSENFNFFAAGV